MSETEESILLCIKALDEHLDELIDAISNLFKPVSSHSINRFLSFLRDILTYNISGGKKVRACLFLASFNAMHECSRNDSLLICSEHVLNKSSICMLAWTIELIQASFLVSDDMMDNSLTRRGKPCWYVKRATENRKYDSETNLEAGVATVNDILFMCYATDNIVNLYFTGEIHKLLMTEIHNVCLKTTVGQHLDMDNSAENSVEQCLIQISLIDTSNLSSIINSMEERYWCTVTHKTSLYTFRMPVVLAYTLAKSLNTADELPELNKLITLTLEMGCMFQVQDDMLDWSSDCEDIKKTKHTDIIEGKLSWPLLMALKMINETNDLSSLSIIKDCYGVLDMHCKIADLYKKLQIQDLYNAKMLEMKENFLKKLKELNHPMMEATLFDFLKIFCLSSF